MVTGRRFQVAPAADLDLLGFQVGLRTVLAGDDQRDERSGILSTTVRASRLERSRTPRRYSSLRSSSASMVSALIMPRSATPHTRCTPKRVCRRSITGISVVTSAVLPGHISQHTGRPVWSMITPTTLGGRSGRWSLL